MEFGFYNESCASGLAVMLMRLLSGSAAGGGPSWGSDHTASTCHTCDNRTDAVTLSRGGGNTGKEMKGRVFI